MRTKIVRLLALVLLLAPVAGWAQQKPTFGTF